MKLSLLSGLVLSLALSGTAAAQQAPAESDVEYFHSDAVGTVRLITSATGTIVQRYDYTPFGTPVGAGPSATQPRGFGGKERDEETGFDYFDARYYASLSSRFTTVDPGHVAGDTFEPQSWNGYAYALNNPLRFIDPRGTCSQDAKGGYLDADDAGDGGRHISPGPCPRGKNGELMAGGETVSVRPKSGIVTLAEEISVRAGPAADPLVIAGFYGASAAGGLALWGGGAFAGAEITTLGLGGVEVGGTPLIKGGIIHGLRISNHLARKAGRGRGATNELLAATIRGAKAAGTVTREVGTGRFAGHQIEIYWHNGIKVVADLTEKVLMSASKPGSWQF